MKRSLGIVGLLGLAACGAGAETLDEGSVTEVSREQLVSVQLPDLDCFPSGDIVDQGYPKLRQTIDMNGDGIKEYCRFVGDAPNVFLSCQKGCSAGAYGTPYWFNSISGIDQGYDGRPRYLADMNGDKRPDFCRWVGDAPNTFFSCDLAEANKFSDAQYGMSLAPNLDPVTLTVESMDPPRPIEGRSVYVTFSLRNNTPYFRTGWVGGLVYPKHAAPYLPTAGDGEWAVMNLAPGATTRGVTIVRAPQADPGVSTSLYYFEDRQQLGEFNLVEGAHFTDAAPFSYDVAARYSIAIDSFHINASRARYNDTDSIGARLAVDGNVLFDNGAAPLFLGDVGSSGDHPIGLRTPSFDLVPTRGEAKISWTLLNSGASLEQTMDKILNGVSAGAAAALSILYPQAAKSWTELNDFTKWINSQQFAGCDGPVALDQLSMTSDFLAATTLDASGYHDFRSVRRYDADGKDPTYRSQAGCGGSPRYDVAWSVHREASPTELLSVYPTQTVVKPGGTVAFSSYGADRVQWYVVGDAASVGYVEPSGVYHAPASLPADRVVRLDASTLDGSKRASVFVGLDMR